MYDSLTYSFTDGKIYLSSSGSLEISFTMPVELLRAITKNQKTDSIRITEGINVLIKGKDQDLLKIKEDTQILVFGNENKSRVGFRIDVIGTPLEKEEKE